jgi:hypothetical protein
LIGNCLREQTTKTTFSKVESTMWTLMLLTGVAAFAALFGFVFACEWL